MPYGYAIKATRAALPVRAKGLADSSLLEKRINAPRFRPSGFTNSGSDIIPIRRAFNELCFQIMPANPFPDARRSETIIPPEYFSLYLLPFLAYAKQNGNNMLFFTERDAQPYERAYRAFQAFPPLLGMELPSSFAYKITGIDRVSLSDQIIGLMSVFPEDKQLLETPPSPAEASDLHNAELPEDLVRLPRKEIVRKLADSGIDPRIQIFMEGYRAIKPYNVWFGGSRAVAGTPIPLETGVLPPEITEYFKSGSMGTLDPETVTRDLLIRLNRYFLELKRHIDFQGRKPLGILLKNTRLRKEVFEKNPLFIDVSSGSGGCFLAVELISSIFLFDEYENGSRNWSTGIMATLPDKIDPRLGAKGVFDIYASIRPVRQIKGEFQIRVPEYNPELFDCLFVTDQNRGLIRASYRDMIETAEASMMVPDKKTITGFKRIALAIQSRMNRTRIPFELILKAYLRGDELSAMGYIDRIRFESDDFLSVYQEANTIIGDLGIAETQSGDLHKLIAQAREYDREIRDYDALILLNRFSTLNKRVINRIKRGCREMGLNPKIIDFCIKFLT